MKFNPNAATPITVHVADQPPVTGDHAMSRTHTFTNHCGVPMLAVLIQTGNRYGRLREDGMRPLIANRPMVEFWDARYPHDKEHRALLVQRYYVDTLAGTCGRATGLLLDAGTPEWSLSADDLSGVMGALQ